MKLYVLLIMSVLLVSCSYANVATVNTYESNSSIEEELSMKFYIDNVEVEVEWENNDSIRQIRKIASGSNIIVNAHHYGGFEQVGEIGQNIVSNNMQISTEPGDIVLYNSNNIVVFYGSNNWSYTKLGKMNISNEEIKNILSNGDVVIKLILGD